ncbi:hypothetical protein H0H87_011995 [Tephrocybe sp. NHM501043]|nr:hypothetical protein H0H87_011995 [Tephrocybe sp. NHM501043]
MSSNEEDYNDNDNSQAAKKRRIQRACDICRRKKIRCDGGQMPGNRCSNCIAYSFECTYVEAAKKRGPPKGYVERLETRVEKLEKVLTKLYPDSDILKEIDTVVDTDAWLIEYLPRQATQKLSAPAPMVTSPQHPCEIATAVIRKVAQPVDFQPDEDIQHVLLADNIKNLKLGDGDQNRFFGKSSGAMLVHAAIELKNEYTGGNDDLRRPILGSKREQFWVARPWERLNDPVSKVTYTYPPTDLMMSLVDLFFEKQNILTPLLHRPTFERSVAEELHLHDDGFATVLLLVCAVASRFSDDPRVLMDDVEGSISSGGWKWFQQVQQVKRSVLAPPSLYDLQYYCLHDKLAAMFLQGSSAPQQCWTLVGIGIRMAQDVGAHRRKHNKELDVTEELWKRGFWVLVSMDRMISSALGRPFDVDFPVECDDEYWEHPDPAKRFKQPANKPSYVTGFISLLKLNQVLTIILRTIYSINKSKVVLGFVGKQWEQHIVAELDSALNKWVDSVPDHLRWDQNRENLKFLDQSAMLYSTYYYIQILIHRSFIPSPRKPSPLAFPSLAICTNAARSCSHIADVYRQRGLLSPPVITMAVFTSGIVLLLNIWNNKRSGLSTDPSKEMTDVHKCMQSIRQCETRWTSAGRLWDIMYELASVGDLPLPKASPLGTSNKRDRDSDSPASRQTSSPTPSSASDTPRAIVGLRRTANKLSQMKLTSPPEQRAPYPLPVYSNELGRLPVNGQVQPVPGPISQQVPTFWGLNAGPELGASSSATTPYQGPLQSTSLPFDIELYNQMAFNYEGAFGSTSASTSMQAPYSIGGGVNAMSIQQQPQPLGMISGQADFSAAGLGPNIQELIDSDSVAMWSNPPSGYDLDDWGTYLTNVSELTHGAIFATACLVLAAAAVPQKRQLAQVITKCTVPNTAALTFDDGPWVYLYDVSKALVAANATGTFFFNGNNYECIYNADEIKRVQYAYDKGHQVASHTWAHKDLTTLTWDQIHDEMWKVELALSRIVGVVPAFMRPPYGNYNDLVRQASAVRGQKVVIWDFDSGDSVGATVAESEASYDDLVRDHPSTVLALNHEVYETTAHQVLPYAIKKLQAAGYRLVSLAECLDMPAYQSVGIVSPQGFLDMLDAVIYVTCAIDFPFIRGVFFTPERTPTMLRHEL